MGDRRTPASSSICRFAAKCSGRTCPVILQCRHRGSPKIPDTYDEYYNAVRMMCPLSRPWIQTAQDPQECSSSIDLNSALLYILTGHTFKKTEYLQNYELFFLSLGCGYSSSIPRSRSLRPDIPFCTISDPKISFNRRWVSDSSFCFLVSLMHCITISGYLNVNVVGALLH